MSQSSDDVVLLDESDQVLTVTLNRPDSLNALDHTLMAALSAAWAEARDPRIRAIVLTGAGRGFCSGADLRAPRAPGRTLGPRARLNPLVLGLASLGKPVIAAINGVAAGAGLGLACAADIRIASSEARFVPAFSAIGITPDAGASFFVPRLIGAARAFEWFVRSDPLDAKTALDIGLLSDVVAPDQLAEVAWERAHSLAKMPGEAVALTKLLVQQSHASTLAEQLELEAELQLQALEAPGREEARASVVAKIQHDKGSDR